MPASLGGSSLVRAYLSGSGVPFFSGHPASLEAYRTKLAEVRGRFGLAERARVARAVRPASPDAEARLRRFVEEGGAVVTTGQQAGFLTGPLYTVYKACTAIRLAEALEAALGVVVLPVFWTASEDHDWEEVNHAHLSDRAGHLHRVELPGGDPLPLPMSDRTLGTEVESTLDDVRQVLLGYEDTSTLVKRILANWSPGISVARAFSGSMLELFSGTALCVTEASDPTIKAATAGVLRRSLERALYEEARLKERVDALRAAGHREQVPILDGATNVFHHGDEGRVRLYRRGEDFGVLGRREAYPREKLLTQLISEPERFSPNVLLRPVVESAFFPTLAYVGGPAEVSYFAQLGVLFEERGMEPPVVVPRFSATLMEEWVGEGMAELGLSLEELRRPRHELVQAIVRRAVPREIAARLEALGERVAGGYRELIEAAEPLDATLVGALASLRNESLARVGRSERKILRAVQRRERPRIELLDRVRDQVYPEEAPQERVLNVLPFLAAGGRGLVERILAAIRIDFAEEGAAAAGGPVDGAASA